MHRRFSASRGQVHHGRQRLPGRVQGPSEGAHKKGRARRHGRLGRSKASGPAMTLSQRLEPKWLRNAANAWHTPSFREAGRRNCSCSVARSEAGGVQGRSASSATWCASEPSARTLPCELPRLQSGGGAGGEHSPWRSSSPWRAQHLDAHGRRPRNQDRATAPLWIVFSTLPRPKGPAVSPCGPKPGPRVAAGELSSSSGLRGLGTLSCRHKSPQGFDAVSPKIPNDDVGKIHARFSVGVMQHHGALVHICYLQGPCKHVFHDMRRVEL